MWKIVELHGIPREVINIMKDVFDGSQSCVRINQGKTTYFFSAGSGVRQGDSLSSLLFNTVLDYVMRRVELTGEGIEMTAGRRLRGLTYADGIRLLAIGLENLRVLTEAVVCKAGKVGLKVNTKKTEIMKVKTNDNRPVIIGNEPLQEVDKFVYLVCESRKDGNIRNEVSIRICKA